MRKQLTTAAAMAVFATTAGVALANGETDAGERRLYRGAGMHHFGDPASMLDHLDARLELEDSQRQRIDNVLTSAHPEMEALRERVEENRKALRDLEVSDTGYQSALANLAREKGDIAAQMTLLHGRIRADIDAVLTPEQRQKLAEGGDRLHRRHKEARAHRRRR